MARFKYLASANTQLGLKFIIENYKLHVPVFLYSYASMCCNSSPSSPLPQCKQINLSMYLNFLTGILFQFN